MNIQLNNFDLHNLDASDFIFQGDIPVDAM